MSTIALRLGTLTEDNNLDLEDILFALQAARADGTLSAAEIAELRAALAPYAAHLEPAAQKLVDDLIAGTATLLPRRVLLAPAPASAPDLYQPRAEVVALQDALTALGHAATADGLYGNGTATRVKEVQAAAGLPQTGQVDTATLLALNERLVAKGLEPLDLAPRARIRPDQVVALRGGANREDTRALQAALSRLGAHLGDDALRLEADGAFGPGTEAGVKAFQLRFYLPETGIVDRTTLGALDDALARFGLTGTGLAGPTVAPTSGAIELHFYPGDAERKVYVVKNGRVLERYGMVGGQNRYADDPNNPNVDYGPSPQGTYTVVRVSPHVSYSWPWSYVPYGAGLRELDGEVQYRDFDGTWRFATGPKGVFRGRQPPPLERHAYRDATGQLYETWQLNDFGHLRGQLASVRTGALQGHMIHSSPHEETSTRNYFRDTRALLDPAEALDVLHYSHGCEHIHPKDFDELVARGWLAPGTTFVVHGYDEVREGPSGPAVA